MKKLILDQAKSVLSQVHNLSRDEYYFLLASFIMYFDSELKKEPWNTFVFRVEQNKIPLEQAVFSTDEEKNPDLFLNPNIPKNTKSEVRDVLFEYLIQTKRKLQTKVPFTPSFHPSEIIVIPDVIDPVSEKPTLFPMQYLKNCLEKGVTINELTGHPFSWETVESVRSGKQKSLEHRKRVQPDILLKTVVDEIERLHRLSRCCIMCKCSSTKFKSIWSYQCIFFCSLRCMEKWDAN
jgi:hypothetical protein